MKAENESNQNKNGQTKKPEQQEKPKQTSSSELPKKLSMPTYKAMIRAAKKKGAEQKAKEAQQEKK